MAKRILVAVILSPFCWASSCFCPASGGPLVVMFISGMAAFELLRATGEGKITIPMRVVTMLSAVLIPLGNWWGQAVPVAFVCLFVVMAVSFWCAIRAYNEGDASIGFYHVMLTLFAGCVIPLGLSTLVQLRGMDYGRYLVLLAVLLSFITDGAAYFGGIFLGRHRGVTRVSPKKSVEGYICGFLGGARLCRALRLGHRSHRGLYREADSAGPVAGYWALCSLNWATWCFPLSSGSTASRITAICCPATAVCWIALTV